MRGEHRTATSIVRYTVLLIGITMLPFAFGELGYLYLGVALALGAGFLGLALGALP